MVGRLRQFYTSQRIRSHQLCVAKSPVSGAFLCVDYVHGSLQYVDINRPPLVSKVWNYIGRMSGERYCTTNKGVSLTRIIFPEGPGSSRGWRRGWFTWAYFFPGYTWPDARVVARISLLPPYVFFLFVSSSHCSRVVSLLQFELDEFVVRCVRYHVSHSHSLGNIHLPLISSQGQPRAT